MARIIPDGWRELEVTGAAQREIETLSLFAAGLSDDYSVYHAVHWTGMDGSYAIYGEIDFAVVNRAGDLLLVEQKSGFLQETPDGLVKQYPGRSKSVPVQLSRMVSNLRGKLAARGDIPSVHTDALLYCPDYIVHSPATAGLVPERIVDARQRDRLCQVIERLLPARAESAATPKIHAFLRNLIQLDSDVSALMGHARTMVTRISGGLAHWARRLDFEPFHLRVTGTAGSGKTQLALAEFRATINAGRRPLYVCYNRPLADHFQRIAPTGGLACSYHQLCDQRVRHAGETPDFTRPDAFERLQQRASELPVAEPFLFDTIIIDEGQDFSEHWRDFVFAHARPPARLLWLEDPLQNLYARAPIPLPGWVTLHARGNYRSPRPVVEMLRRVLPELLDVEAVSPIAADEIDILTYTDTPGLFAKVKEAVRNCYSAGFKKHDLAIVSYHGRQQSNLMPLDRLGQITLRRFTGHYDLFGQPIYSAGDVLLESVYRFKGQAAPAIIFAEVDFDQLDDKAVRKLFVGVTRSMMKLVLILREKSAAHLFERIG
ncbi:MAG: ATP-binding domain-containing protein [Candidatus Accumulibacter sp.]|uniref:ATP-binding domain-containing protein n=1 Tax=Accumulibacter sp. TaxID=2053492 RepID=UPI001A57276C|nr:ATP-binding domain-containing protein [Accumulibacter sp.]MBL8396474.1 ATP-binding domain-containing protein [Accumulibacter sp.]